MSAYATRHSSRGFSSHQERNHSQLAIALGEFQQVLTPEQTAQLNSYSNHAPTAADVVRLTDQVTQSNANRKSRVFASRLQGLLGSIQQYCNIIDTCAGPNQIAALVWGSIKLVILVCTPYRSYSILAYTPLSARLRQTLQSISTSCQNG
jgi:hypothetical protein